MAEGLGRVTDLQDVYCLVKYPVADSAYKRSGDTITGTVGQPEYYPVLLPAEEIEITADNILGFI